MNNRSYNKLYVNKNREEGSEKLLLGYQFDSKEVILNKDQETYFHIPTYTQPLRLRESSLLLDGAIGGPFPAASDRIFKSRKNFGKVTQHGDPVLDLADGVWFCSWLYKSPSGSLQWLDRIYNPGSFVYTVAGEELFEAPFYQPSTSIFRDIPSLIVFEPGVLFKYYHIGEKTFQQLTSNLAGLSGERLLMDLSNWEQTEIDASENKINPQINTSSSQSLFGISTDNDRPEKQIITLDSINRNEIIINFDQRYNPTEEFSLTFWSKCANWEQNPTTQLAGNYSSKGGYGLFVQNLSSYQLFAIPETNYGHLLFINESGGGFLDRSTQLAPKVNNNPKFCAVDFDGNIVVASNDNTGLFYKLDNAGKVLASSREKPVPFTYLQSDEIPQQLLVGHNNTIIVITQRTIYTFDENLNKIIQVPRFTKSSEVASFIYDSSEDFVELEFTDNVLDTKFIETTQWMILASNGNLYKKEPFEDPILFFQLAGGATNFSVDPFNRLWVLHGNNNLTIVNSNDIPLSIPVLTTSVGSEDIHPLKNISFVCRYDAKTKQFQWNAVVYYSNDSFIYFLNMDGQLIKTVNKNSLFNQTVLNSLEQADEEFKFEGRGDFTGYEHRRIFKNLSPYNNKNQIVLKYSLKDNSKPYLFYTTFSQRFAIDDWENNTWQHFVVSLKNKTFNVHLNSIPKIQKSFEGGLYELSYELQPIFFIGTSGGSQAGFNQEIQNESQIFNGSFGDIKLYDYALNGTDLEMFLKAFTNFSDISWNMPIPSIQYIEEVERMFKNKIPGFKSPLYKIKIRGTRILDQQTKDIIAEEIKTLAFQSQPAYSDFLEIEWVD